LKKPFVYIILQRVYVLNSKI